ncbi:MAG TPA: YfhO family protein, partial [Thermomicrobiales bacterium]|nr:YfhO family protein [Thermomicrobiales bacterium]
AVFTCGPFLEWNTHTSLQFAQLGAWIPLVLLGIELAVRRARWVDRLVPWCVAAVALSQMFAGWVGEGWIYAVVLVCTYTGYRAFLASPVSGHGWRARLLVGVSTGLAVGFLGAALAAAGILPRLAANAETRLAGGDYDALGSQGILNDPWKLDYLLVQLMGMGTEYHHRAAGLGGAVLVLTLLAPMMARARFAVPFFAGITVVFLVLALDETPIHQLFYLIPQYQELHEHDPWRVVALATFGPAMMSGATVESLGRWRGQYRMVPIALIPLGLILLVAKELDQVRGVTGWPPIVAAATVTAAVLLVIAVPAGRGAAAPGRWVPGLGLTLILLAVFVQPTGLEITGARFGWPDDPRWQNVWDADSRLERALATHVSETDPGSAGAFLQERLDESGPFRYLGYAGAGHEAGGPDASSYMSRRADPYVQAILVNGRPMFLDLYEIQGYDPIQLDRYVDVVAAINGKEQDYHTAFVSDEGVRSPLLDLLNVRYVLIDASIPPDRADIAGLIEGRDEVFRNDRVVVYETQSALPHAWIVHDVRSVEQGEALRLLVDGDVDPYRIALVEGSVPAVGQGSEGAADEAIVTRYGADTIVIETSTDASGFLVVSEINADGWQAYVDGEPVEIVQTHHALRGLPIPAGDHTVEMRYRPVSLLAGVWISGAAAVLVLGVFGGAAGRSGRAWTSVRRPASRPSTSGEGTPRQDAPS